MLKNISSTFEQSELPLVLLISLMYLSYKSIVVVWFIYKPFHTKYNQDCFLLFIMNILNKGHFIEYIKQNIFYCDLLSRFYQGIFNTTHAYILKFNRKTGLT